MTELEPRRAFRYVLISVNPWLKKTHFSHRFTQISLIFVVAKQMSSIRVIRVIRAIRDLPVLIFVDSKNHREVIQC